MAIPAAERVNAIAARLHLIRLAYSAAQGRPKPMSQSEFARACGLTVSNWHNSETAGNRIGIDSALAVSRRTGASLDFIYKGDRGSLPHALAIEIDKIESAPRSLNRA